MRAPAAATEDGTRRRGPAACAHPGCVSAIVRGRTYSTIMVQYRAMMVLYRVLYRTVTIETDRRRDRREVLTPRSADTPDVATTLDRAGSADNARIADRNWGDENTRNGQIVWH